MLALKNTFKALLLSGLVSVAAPALAAPPAEWQAPPAQGFSNDGGYDNNTNDDNDGQFDNWQPTTRGNGNWGLFRQARHEIEAGRAMRERGQAMIERGRTWSNWRMVRRGQALAQQGRTMLHDGRRLIRQLRDQNV